MSQQAKLLEDLQGAFSNIEKAGKEFKKGKKKLPYDLKQQMFSQISENTENKELVKSIISKLF